MDFSDYCIPVLLYGSCIAPVIQGCFAIVKFIKTQTVTDILANHTNNIKLNRHRLVIRSRAVKAANPPKKAEKKIEKMSVTADEHLEWEVCADGESIQDKLMKCSNVSPPSRWLVSP